MKYSDNNYMKLPDVKKLLKQANIENSYEWKS
jgi:hypothetical protein